MYSSVLRRSPLVAMIAAVAASAALPGKLHAEAAETTLTKIITGSDQPGLYGYRKLVSQSSSAGRVVRTLDDGPEPSNMTPTQSLLAFGHMSDTHICDDQSPARVPFMDKRFDIDHSWGTNSAYRPQERLSTQMSAAMVSSLRNLGAAPATGLPLAFTLVTGDMVDNSQYNETRWYIDLMDGGLIRPNNWSSPSVEEGPGYGVNDTKHKYNLQSPWSASAILPSAYYHPDGGKPFSNSPPDWYLQHGFPIIPSLLQASRRDFVSPGLGMPWYAVFGNHDMAVQGNLPDLQMNGFSVGERMNFMAVGDERIREVDLPWIQPSGTLDQLGTIIELLSDTNRTSDVAATADPNRRLLDKGQFMDEHFATGGWPVGHGFNSTGKPYYVMPSSGPNDRFKFIALDTTNANGFGAGGWIDAEQWNWLLDELKSASSRYWNPGTESWVVNPSGRDKLIVLYGHHTLTSMDKITEVDGLPAGYSGEELKRLLLRFPNVIMLVNGHTHENSIRGHFSERPDTHTGISGFWEITSPAALDFPAQSRVIEVGLTSTGAANGVPYNNYLSIYTTMLDIDAPVSVDVNSAMTDYRQLASVGRELAYNDPGEAGPGAFPMGWRAGKASDRNTQLVLPVPFPMNDFPSQGERGTHVVTQSRDTRDVKILKMGINFNLLSTVDVPAASLQNSEVIGTGHFTQGLKMGQDLVLRDASGNIRIKLLDMNLAEASYPEFGETVRGTVDVGTTLSGIGDFDGDGRSDLLWTRQDNLWEIWFSGSSADRKTLNYYNDNDTLVPDPGAANYSIVAVGDFNADGYSDVLLENSVTHAQAVWWMNGATRVGDYYPSNWQYAYGYEIAPGLVGNVLEQSHGDNLVYRKLSGSQLGQLMVADRVYPWSRAINYQNVLGWNSDMHWRLTGLADFNVDGKKDVLWRHSNGTWAVWFLNSSLFLGDAALVALDTNWEFRGLLKNTMQVIY